MLIVAISALLAASPATTEQRLTAIEARLSGFVALESKLASLHATVASQSEVIASLRNADGRPVMMGMQSVAIFV